MGETINWESEDKKYIWHPAMQMKDNEVHPPVFFSASLISG